MAQLLDASSEPRGVADVVARLGFLQIDPTAVVARTEHLVLWSRLGSSFSPTDLDRAVFVDHTLYEHRAFIYPREDFPLYRPLLEAWPAGEGNWYRRAREFLGANQGFIEYILGELAARGPLRSRDLEDRSVQSWESTGWTHGRNVGQMLEFLAAQGRVAVAGREGSERLWDLGERVLPYDLPPLSAEEAARRREERRREALGLDETGREFAGRAAVLSPFDRLVYDRARCLELFGFEYKLEMYVPAAKRRWGYYVLPILVGDRLVGRVDARLDRRQGLLRVLSLGWEPHATTSDRAAGEAEIHALAAWLGASVKA